MIRKLHSQEDNRPWLQKVHKQKKERSLELGKSAIDTLVREGNPVTLKTIQEKSKELDPYEKGIHSNTVKTNEELYEYYKLFSKTYKQKQVLKPSVIDKTEIEFDFRKIQLERELGSVRQRYKKLKKDELIQRLIQAEQFIAENNQQWAKSIFEQFK